MFTRTKKKERGEIDHPELDGLVAGRHHEDVRVKPLLLFLQCPKVGPGSDNNTCVSAGALGQLPPMHWSTTKALRHDVIEPGKRSTSQDRAQRVLRPDKCSQGHA